MQKEELLQKITGAENDATSLRHKLTDLVHDYPWFGAPHYFLLQQMEKNEAGYNNLAAKTALHFSHPHLLQYSLNNFYPAAKNDVKGFTPGETGISSAIEFHGDDLEKEASQHEVELNQDLVEEKNEIEVIAVPNETLEEEIIEPGLSSTPNEMFTEETIASDNNLKLVHQNDEMIFEPLYASDYFASQGIKLSEQEIPTDKLGKQVKSFTDWLKTMKKLPGTQATQVMHVDNNVEQLAEKSNTGAEVITETMAEVFIQQGRNARAIEIYQKLSLLNPSKSAFFAAKIDHLKNGEH